MAQFAPGEVAFLRERKVGNMAQLGSDGLPHATPLCYSSTRDAIYIETSVRSWKVRNLERRSEVAFVVDDYFDDWGKLCGIRMQGNVEVLSQGREYESGKRLLFEKYPDQFEGMGWTDGVHVVMKITPTKVTSWGLQ